MSFRFSRWIAVVAVVATVLLIAGRCWAVYYPLGPSKDEWGLKYDLQVSAAEGDKLNVLFTLADEGRLKPIYSVTVVAFSDPYPDKSQSVLANAPIVLKPTKDGKLTGQAQLKKELSDRAQIRILTFTVNGKRQTAGAASYYIPLKKFLDKAPVAASPTAKEAKASPRKAKGPITR